MINLIANTGIHFKKTEVEFNPNDAYILPNGRPLKFTFVEKVDYLNDCRITFDVCSIKNGSFVPTGYLRDNNLFAETPSGTIILDDCGVPKMKPEVEPSVVESYSANSPEIINISSLGSYMLRDPQNTQDMKSAFQLLLNTWLPMPMFEMEVDGVTTPAPMGWCRVKIEPIGEMAKDGQTQRFRLTWAFDTKLADGMIDSFLRPYFSEGDGEKKHYELCNRADNMFGFLAVGEDDGDTAIADYIISKLGIDLSKLETQRYKFVGYYIYLCNLLRVIPGAAPVVDLYNKTDKEIPVDLSIDIGNSRTCAILFEEGDFRRARELHLRDLSHPWNYYDKPFDMHIVFRKADFGNDLILGDGLFRWPSIVRVGEEASYLMHMSQEDNGLSMRATNYSSPKRYLWDKKKYKDRWEFLIKEDDPTNVKIQPQIYVEGFTDYFDADGTYMEQPKQISIMDLGSATECKYSRSSLMTFVMIELLQQAIVDINSEEWHSMWLNIDCRRYLRNVIVTCPTAMPNTEQITLRQSAVDAFNVLKMFNPKLHDIKVTPSPDQLRITDDMQWENHGWSYDEAFASQLMYLYGEVADRYKGENDRIIEMKGHKRPEHISSGYDRKSLTIGSIDIGAGTTDVMITAYQYSGSGRSRLIPEPLFWDSFYLAGDDVVKQIIINQIIEGPSFNDENMGGIYSATECRLLHMTDEQLEQLPIMARHDTEAYRDALSEILRSRSKRERANNIRKLAADLVHGYFGEDSSLKTVKDRICRNDFNTQVSVRIAQFYLQQLSERRPMRTFGYNEIFSPEHRPADYLLEHFARHFGFRFEELSWCFDPKKTGYYVRTTLEPLMKLLSVVLEAYDCDIIVLSGRPCSLDDVSELFIKYYPTSPDRLVRLNEHYHIGTWYPGGSAQGFFRNPKSVVAVGAMVGFKASNGTCPDMELDFSKVVKNLKSTARYIGIYKTRNQQVDEVLLSPTQNSVMLRDQSYPVFLGCKQFSTPNYSARPLYAIYNHSSSASINIMLQRNYMQNREELQIISAMDKDGNDIPLTDIELVQQSIADDGLYWLDKGEFELKRDK